MFKSPIELLDSNDRKTITKETNQDLELSVVYEDILGPSVTSVRDSWLNTFTTKTPFLKDTQRLLSFPSSRFPKPLVSESKRIQTILDTMWNNVSFREKYEYITFGLFEKLNSNDSILQMIAMYTLSSPIISLMTPIVMLFIPFFIVKFMGRPITMGNYLEQLKRIFSMLPIGQLFKVGEASWDQRGVILFSIILYVIQMYQNTMTCYKFYKHSKEMVNEIHACGQYCNNSVASMKMFSDLVKKEECHTYTPFIENMGHQLSSLTSMAETFLMVNRGTFSNMGKKMKVYYDLFSNKKYKETFEYSFAYEEYIDNIRSLVNLSYLRPCKFSTSKLSLKNGFYSLLRDNNPVPNSLSLSKNIILSGPNASGKTTLLKSTLINIILSQQIGMGFYEKATITPQDYLHCYINIPDSCGRDSLFQAEARRCKEILETIHRYPYAKHLCVFDELFSGTNPYEAVACAYGYLNYLHTHKNVKYILTTHYLELCEHLEKETDRETSKSGVINYTLERKYVLQKGISTIKGGIKVIQDLEFPEEILKTAKTLVSLN
jgi:hypothetical protein